MRRQTSIQSSDPFFLNDQLERLHEAGVLLNPILRRLSQSSPDYFVWVRREGGYRFGSSGRSYYVEYVAADGRLTV